MTEPARVTVSLGYTRNMGNFESLRVDLSIEDSVRPSEGEGKAGIEAAMNRLNTFLEQKLVARVKEIEKELK